MNICFLKYQKKYTNILFENINSNEINKFELYLLIKYMIKNL